MYREPVSWIRGSDRDLGVESVREHGTVFAGEDEANVEVAAGARSGTFAAVGWFPGR
jgi:hypothetical protein